MLDNSAQIFYIKNHNVSVLLTSNFYRYHNKIHLKSENRKVHLGCGREVGYCLRPDFTYKKLEFF